MDELKLQDFIKMQRENEIDLFIVEDSEKEEDEIEKIS